MSDVLERVRVLCVILVVLGTSAAGADGGFFWDAQFAGSAQLEAQRAIILFDGQEETIIFQTSYAGDAGDVAWVIPVPTVPESTNISTAPERLFEGLYATTEPRMRISSNAPVAVGCGACGPAAAPLEGELADYPGVTVWDTLQVDQYDVSVVSGTDPEELSRWLEDNGYTIPAAAADALAYYTSRQSAFVAAKVSEETLVQAQQRSPAQARQLGVGLKPLRITFDSTATVFPLRISATNAGDETEIVLYVFAPHRVTCDNLSTVDMEPPAVSSPASFPQSYREQFESLVTGTGTDRRALVVEFAHEWPFYPVGGWALPVEPLGPQELVDLGLLEPDQTMFLTRLHSVLTPQDMSEDLAFAYAQDDAVIDLTDLWPADQARSRAGVVLACAALLALALVPGKPSRRLARGALLVFLLLLAVGF